MPLLSYAIKIYNLKLMDEYALEVIRFICKKLSKLDDENQFVQSGAVEATFQAIKNGIPEIAIELIPKADDAKADNSKNHIFANILSGTDPEDSRNMFASAIAHRQEKVARFLHEFCASEETNMITIIDKDGNNILHVAAQLAPLSQLDHISGAPLQLQSELRWFKSVKGIVPRFYHKQKNKDGETPTQVFLREHRNLLKEAEEWMKKAAEACTVVGALIITVMFAAAFTVPGGNNQETGFPVFLNTSSSTASVTVAPFMVFTVSDSISLFAASSSVLMFMGILTSRYACQDFHISLPMKLMIGLSALFISIAAMMAAFCATLLMVLHEKTGTVISIIFLATIPVTLFILLQSPLLVEIYTSTFRPDIFYRRKYLKSEMRFCLSLNRRWWFRARKGRMVIMLCALFLLYLISFAWFAIEL
ncbi:hypothetical protein SLEP1_g15283 [Rubroshorea leprosula]|uniref:PGG domain-containing protein n=1 Tax=Rubroshorea leprosula TaxID=152421 RepID=A0AAV5IR57_9ROSI|nr:hypothetical protein SLEP1_g15283 [Rubroshorea leprosula]